VWAGGTVTTALAPDRLLAEHAALLSVLHANVATEIGIVFNVTSLNSNENKQIHDI
jgi:hypothetical protein